MTVKVEPQPNAITLKCRVCKKLETFMSNSEEPQELVRESSFPVEWVIVAHAAVFDRLMSTPLRPFALCPEHRHILFSKEKVV